MNDEDILAMLARDPEIGAVLRKPRFDLSDARNVGVRLRAMQGSEAGAGRTERAARIAILRRMLAAPTRAPSREAVVTYNDFDAQMGLWPNGSTPLVLQGARDKQPWIFMGFAWTGPVGVGVTSLKLSTFDSVDTSNFTTALAGASQVIDLSFFTPDSQFWITPKSRPNFQTIPFGTIVGGTQNLTITLNNAGPPALGTLTVLKWTPNPGCRTSGVVSLDREVQPGDRAHAKLVRRLWENDPGTADRILGSLRGMVAGYEYEDEDDDLL